jgi:hypothetical protein
MATNSANCTIVGQSYSTSALGEYRNDAAYAGYSGNAYYVYSLKFTMPEFAGASECLSVGIIASVGIGSTSNLRWALCTSDANNASYTSTTEAVTDEYQIASGMVTCENLNSSRKTYLVEIETTQLRSGETYYLLMWASEKTGISVSAVSSGFGDHSASLDYNAGVVYIAGEAYIAYVRDTSSWDLCIPHIYDGSEWDICS